MMAKMDATSHHWVASLANYNVQLYYSAGKTNINVDALSRHPGLDVYPILYSHITKSLQQWHEPCRRLPSKPCKSYWGVQLWPACPGPVGNGPQVTCMTAHDWWQAQWSDPVLGLVIVRMQDRTIGQCPFEPTDPLQLWQLLWECNNFKLRWGILYRKIHAKGIPGGPVSIGLTAPHQETTLRGCHGKTRHLGLERMLNLMCNHFFWSWMAIQAKEHIKKCHKCISFKGKATEGPRGEYHGYPPPWASAHQLPVPGAREGKGRKHPGGNGTLHLPCPCICHSIPDGLDNDQGPLGQFHHPLQVNWKNPFRPGGLERQYWCTGPCMQLHPQFCHRLQTLFPNEWQATWSPHQCHPQNWPRIDNKAHFHQICPEIEGLH